MELIGEFSTKLMTLAECYWTRGNAYWDEYTQGNDSAYDMLLGGSKSSKSSKKGGAAAFASRCVETKFPTTLADLVSTPPDDLEIDTDRRCRLCLRTTLLDSRRVFTSTHSPGDLQSAGVQGSLECLDITVSLRFYSLGVQ